jgi:hypothetical protein
MKKLRILFLVLFSAAAFGQTPPPGAKATGIGGSFVAEGNDASALWGNPSGITLCPLGCAEIFAGGIATDENEFANKLRDDFKGVRYADFADGQHLDRIPKLVSDLESFQTTGTGVIGSGSAGLVYAIHGFAIGIGGTAQAGAYPTVDLVNVTPSTFVNNASSVTLRGLETREVRLAYSYAFAGLTLGAATRYIQGRTYSLTEPLLNAADDPVQVARDALKRNERRTNRVAFDLGAIYAIPKFRMGIVAQGFNKPTFRVFDGSKITLPHAVRAGAALAITGFDGIVVSFDADLNKQPTLVPGLSTRRIGGGLQFYLFRVGAFRDLEAVDRHWAYTAGLNLSAKVLSLGVSAVYSKGKRDVGAAVEVRAKI